MFEFFQNTRFCRISFSQILKYTGGMKLFIEHLSIQGDGIAKGPDGPIYVPFTLPTEEIEGEVIGNRIPNPRILTPSDYRVRPPCSHFKTCGGCALQHVEEGFLADWKAEVVETALAAHGLTADVRPTITSPAQTRRRATFSGRRTKKGAMVGLHGRASDSIVAIPSCTLLHPSIIAAVPAMEAFCKIGAARKGSISIGITQTENGPDISVFDAKEADAAVLTNLGQLSEEFKLSRLSWNGEVVALRAPPVQSFDGISVTPPPSAFLQATEAGQNALTQAVIEAIGPAKNIVDLFAGCGTFSLPLSKQAQVLAVEGEASLLIALDAGWREADGLKTVRTEKRDLFRNPLLPEDLTKFDAVVIDPPRAGAKAQCEALANSTLPRIAFVSCNPVTFARDARILCEAGYSIDWIQVVDQFRWSPHVELVAQFTRQPER